MKNFFFKNIEILIFLALPISYCFVKLFYGDIYLQNQFFIYLFIFIFINFISKNSEINFKAFPTSLFILLVVAFINLIIAPIYSNLNFFSLIIITSFFILLNEDHNYKFLKKINHIFFFIVYHFSIISFLIYIPGFIQKSINHDTPYFFMKLFYEKEWVMELLLLSIVLINILQISFGSFGKKNILLMSIVFIFSSIFAIHIISIILLVQFILIILNNFHYKKFTFLLLTFSLILFLKFFIANHILSLSTFLSQSFGIRWIEFKETMNIVFFLSPFGLDYISFFDNSSLHSYFTILSLYSGIIGFISNLIIIGTMSFMYFKKYDYFLSISLSIFLIGIFFTYSNTPTYFLFLSFLAFNRINMNQCAE